MPYVDEAARQDLVSFTRNAEMAGELNYILTLEIVRYVLDKGLGYAAINDVLGATEGCKLEFYRRVAAPYEDRKRADNGDVYPDALLSVQPAS